MKKCAKLTLAMAAVALFTTGEASARPPVVNPHRAGVPVVRHRVPVGPSGVSPAARVRASQVRRYLGLPGGVGAGAAFAGSQFPKHWVQRAAWVRTNLHRRYHGVFTPQWYAAHPGAWRVMRPQANLWAAVAWPTLANWVGVTGAYTPYAYGTFYEDDTYYVTDEGVPVAEESETMVEQFTDDPAELAAQGQSQVESAKDPSQWLPLGVFTITSPEAKTAPSRLFQFAINKNGQLAGSYYDTFSGQTMPIQGAVNKDTQHAAWTVGSQKQTVMETSLGSFTQDQAAVTVYSAGGQSEQWMMVRLEQPKTSSSSSPNTTPTSPQGATTPNPSGPQGTN